MLAPTPTQAPIDGDTVHEVPRRRRLRGRVPGRPERPATGAPGTSEVPLHRGDPGDTACRASWATVLVREAIVRRNRAVDRREAEQRRPEVDSGPTLVRLDFVRAGDPGLRVRRRGRDGLWAEGEACGGTLGVGIEGLIFSVRTDPGDTPQTALNRLRERLSRHFEVAQRSCDAGGSALRLVSPVR